MVLLAEPRAFLLAFSTSKVHCGSAGIGETPACRAYAATRLSPSRGGSGTGSRPRKRALEMIVVATSSSCGKGDVKHGAEYPHRQALVFQQLSGVELVEWKEWPITKGIELRAHQGRCGSDIL